jgi:putative oxidoreductase
MSNSSGGVTSLIGRILMSPLLLTSGFFKITAYSTMVGYATAMGVPMAKIGIIVAAALELLGGLAILIGLQVRVVSWILFVYLIPVTFLFHGFWSAERPQQQNLMYHFLKNLAIMGGMLLLAANGAGAYSVDASRKKSA